MNFILYPFMAVFSILITLVAVILAPVLPLFATMQMGWYDNHSFQAIAPRLPSWLGWFMTPDNSLDGDATFLQANPPSYWSQVKWLWRNPAYSFGLRYLEPPYNATWSGDKTIKDNDGAKAGWCFVRANGLFQFVWIKSIGFNRCVRVTLGWNIAALVDDNVNPKPNPYQATFVFSPRLSGFRP